MYTTTLSVQGMTCTSCVASIQSMLEGVEGIEQFTISLLLERAIAVHDPSIISPDQIAEKIEDCGFDASVISSTEGEHGVMANYLLLSPMQAEQWTKVHNHINELQGVLSVNCSSSPDAAIRVIYDSEITGPRSIMKEILSMGVKCTFQPVDSSTSRILSLQRGSQIRVWKIRFIISISFSLAVMFLPQIFDSCDSMRAAFLVPHYFGICAGHIISLVLSLPVQFGVGRVYYSAAYHALKRGTANMDVLVSLGSTVAFAASIFFMILYSARHADNPAPIFFDTADMLLTFVTLGRYLESKAKGSTSAALSQLLSLAPSSATIIEDNEQIEILADLIERGDLVLVKPGEIIPVDGMVVEGSSYVDESSVSGEPVPVHKTIDDELLSGTANGNGRLLVKATKSPRESQLAVIVDLVQRAQISHAPIQQFADRVAGIFVPVIVALSISTFTFWFLFTKYSSKYPSVFDDPMGKFAVCLKLTISVVVVACPCALGLSTPTAVMVGTGVGALNGIIIKGGEILERLNQVDTVVFDKTGTLTVGKLSVTDISIVDNLEELLDIPKNIFWAFVKASESSSEHPIGKAITEKASEFTDVSEIGIESFNAVPGEGVDVVLRWKERTFHALLGNSLLLEHNNVSIPDDFDSKLKLSSSSGLTCVRIAIDGQFVGFLGCMDQVRPDSYQTVSALKQLGKKVCLLTGDQKATARRVAQGLEIDFSDVYAEAVPSQKAEIIQKLKDQKHCVAMVGDGINDSPSLVLADVGIAPINGSGIALESADVILVRKGVLLDTAVSFDLSRVIVKRIKMNLVWACIYNFVMIPIAMGFFLPWGIYLNPMWASAAMMFSSLSVLASSLLLRRWKKPKSLIFSEADDVETESSTNSSVLQKVYTATRSIFGRNKSSNKYQPVANEV